MVSAELAAHVAERPSACPPDDLPQWRDRLEQIWRLQVEEIIELSLAYHEAASVPVAGRRPDPASLAARRLGRILTRTAFAHHALAEIEAALGRVDAGSYGICGHCRLPFPADVLHACPQARYCPDCRPLRGCSPPP
jgi:RNA polymerase-binding transcription factor